MLTKISSFDLDEIEVFPERCVNNKFSSEKKCNLCRESCIVDSINIDNGLKIDWSKCIKCGICSGICPTEVFKIRKPSDTMILDVIFSSINKEIISITCNHVDGRFSSIPIPSSSNNRIVVSCISRFSETFLLILMLIGGNRIKINKCKGCTFDEGLDVVERIQRRSNNLLELFSGYDNMEFNPSQEQVVYKERELVQDAIKTSFKSILKQEKENYNKLKPNIVLPNRSRLIEIAKILKDSRKSINGYDFPFNKIQIDKDSCSVNGKCASVCPTESLQFISDNQGQELNFMSGYCIGCDFCIEACPNSSLKLNKTLDLAALISPRKTIIEKKFRLCESCGNQFTSKFKDSVMCSACVSRWSVIDRFSKG
jgi:ferredoxin